ncbi:MAG: DUF1360 domain-containing protein [Patescibacteria group bacterium]
MLEQENRYSQYKWNFFYSVFFVALIVFATYSIIKKFNGLPTTINHFDFFLIALATFRVVRLFVYDKVTKFIREPLSTFESGPLKTAYELLICPWCFGVWSAFSLVFFYYYFYQWFWWVILALAISAFGTFLQIVANMIGWKAEGLKLEAESKGSPEKTSGSCGVN